MHVYKKSIIVIKRRLMCYIEYDNQNPDKLTALIILCKHIKPINLYGNHAKIQDLIDNIYIFLFLRVQ